MRKAPFQVALPTQEAEFGLTEISGMGVMIYDGEDGRFDLRLASVHAFLAPPEQQGQ